MAVMVECLTDNVKRTAPEMRVLFRKEQLGTSGSVAWDFRPCRHDRAEACCSWGRPERAAIEAGAQDVELAMKTARRCSSPNRRTWTPWSAALPPGLYSLVGQAGLLKEPQ